MCNNLTTIETQYYTIYIGKNAFVALHEFLVQHYFDSKKIIIVDENTINHCLPLIDLNVPHLKNAEVIEIESGEQHKNLDITSGIWSSLIEMNADRKSLIINLGGGVISDIGGFVASTFKRGIDFINIPTTLLAQVDASVGGKVGIDFDNFKNQIGVFNNPKSVFIYPEFLQTLPPRQLLSGYAEVVKHALIKDVEYWKMLQEFDVYNANFVDVIEHSIRIKNAIVMEDPLEMGSRKLLNFGHTIGHAIESSFLENQDELLHGEAVAMGMICEAYIAVKSGDLKERDLNEIVDFISSTFNLVPIKEKHHNRLVEFMNTDKKNEGGLINFTYLSRIGQGEINQTCKLDVIIDSFNFYNSLLEQVSIK